MGCNSSNQASIQVLMIKRIKECIQLGDTEKLYYCIKRLSKMSNGLLNINTLTVTNNDNLEVNIIGFALLTGRLNVFQFIHKKLKADLSIMETFFTKANLTGLMIICQNNFIDLFQYYAPLFVRMKNSLKSKQNKRLRETIELTDKIENIIDEMTINDDSTYAPLQIACYYGHIAIIKCALNSASIIQPCPPDLDINYIDEITGENCALISCKTGNYNMMKFLHTTCHADFFILNNNKENSIQVLAAAAKVKQLKEFYQCLVYLVEKIGIDIAYNYHETLILIDSDIAFNYMINQLAKVNIVTCKKDIEKELLLKLTRKTTLAYEADEIFDLANMFPELHDDDESPISEIENINDTSFPLIFQE